MVEGCGEEGGEGGGEEGGEGGDEGVNILCGHSVWTFSVDIRCGHFVYTFCVEEVLIFENVTYQIEWDGLIFEICT